MYFLRQCDVEWLFWCCSLCVVGIANHEEYSLVCDMPDDYKEKTLTLKKEKSIAKDQDKLEKMRKKLHTDDERQYKDINGIIIWLHTWGVSV